MTLWNWVGLVEFILFMIGALIGSVVTMWVWEKIYGILDNLYWKKSGKRLEKTTTVSEFFCNKK